MSGVLKIYRDDVLIADGLPDSAFVTDCPLASCTHAFQIEGLLRASTVDVLDRITKKTVLPFKISRQFLTGPARSLDHALRGPKVATGKFILRIVRDDETGLHIWSLADRKGTGAAWEEVTIESVLGVRVLTGYKVTGGIIAYSGPFAADYDDSLPDSSPFLETPGGDVLETPGGQPMTM